MTSHAPAVDPAVEAILCGARELAGAPTEEPSSGEGWRSRTRFDARQLRVLGEVYDVDPVPSIQVRAMLAASLGVTPRTIQVWFQNKRQRMRRKREAANNPSSAPAPWPSRGDASLLAALSVDVSTSEIPERIGLIARRAAALEGASNVAAPAADRRPSPAIPRQPLPPQQHPMPHGEGVAHHACPEGMYQQSAMHAGVLPPAYHTWPHYSCMYPVSYQPYPTPVHPAYMWPPPNRLASGWPPLGSYWPPGPVFGPVGPLGYDGYGVFPQQPQLPQPPPPPRYAQYPTLPLPHPHPHLSPNPAVTVVTAAGGPVTRCSAPEASVNDASGSRHARIIQDGNDILREIVGSILPTTLAGGRLSLGNLRAERGESAFEEPSSRSAPPTTSAQAVRVKSPPADESGC